MDNAHEMLPECGERFKHIGEGLARMDSKLDRLCRAVVGNGDPRNSLASRLTILETARVTEQKATDRGWKAIAIIATLIAVAISAYQALAK